VWHGSAASGLHDHFIANPRGSGDAEVMMRPLLLAFALAGCGVSGYYVANVYTTPSGLVAERCAISQNNRVHPDDCHVEPVAPLPVALMPAWGPPPGPPQAMPALYGPPVSSAAPAPAPPPAQDAIRDPFAEPRQ
jgi:hypothetical protein